MINGDAILPAILGYHFPGQAVVVAQNGRVPAAPSPQLYLQYRTQGWDRHRHHRARYAVGAAHNHRRRRFDPTKFGWIGTPTVDTNVCIAYHTATVKTLRDLYSKELIVGAVGTGVGSYNYPRALNRIIGTKFKVVTGFPGSADVFLANGAWRRGRLLRKPRQCDRQARRLDLDRQGRAAVPGRRRSQSGAEKRTVHPGFCTGHGRPASDPVPLRGAGHWSAVPGATRPSAAAARDAAHSLRRHHARRRVRRRCQEAKARPRAEGRPTSRRADRHDLRDATRGDRACPGSDQETNALHSERQGADR